MKKTKTSVQQQETRNNHNMKTKSIMVIIQFEEHLSYLMDCAFHFTPLLISYACCKQHGKSLPDGITNELANLSIAINHRPISTS